MDVVEVIESDDSKMEPLSLPSNDEQVAAARDKSTEWKEMEDCRIRIVKATNNCGKLLPISNFHQLLL